MARDRVHFIGIGGSGMSGIAQILLEMDYRVSGSDLTDSARTRRLEGMGARMYIGHSRENVRNADMVVISSAIPDNNVELDEARKTGKPVYKRAEILGRIMNDKFGIAVAGTHGKTTTTSMIARILDEAGADPTVIVGGEVNDIGSNARLGKGHHVVVEADESDGSLLYLEPKITVVTNVEEDHMDYYRTADRLKETFRCFLEKIPDRGLAVVCADSPMLMEVSKDLPRRLATYTLEEGREAIYSVRDICLSKDGAYFRACRYNCEIGDFRLRVLGRHNVSNALASIAVALELGVPVEKIKRALAEFTGVQRRYQYVGEAKGVKIYEDYAHHPTEIRALLDAASTCGYSRIVVLFQPHRYTRTQHLYREFGRAFEKADVLVLTGIYPAGEKLIPGVSGKLIEEEARKSGHPHVQYAETLDEAKKIILDILRPGDTLFLVGAGDVNEIGPEILSELKMPVNIKKSA